MPSPADFLQRLICSGAELWAEGDKLRVRGATELLGPDVVADLREHKAALLDLLPGLRFDLPLSPGQEALWLIQRGDPGCAAYNVGLALRVTSDDDADPGPRLRAALQRLVARHLVLRASFPAVDGHPRQRVRATCAAELHHVDARGLAPSDLDDTLSRLHLQPFDLADDLPIRSHLVRVGPRERVLLVCIHHIAVDGWSMRMLVDELLALVIAGDGPNPLQPLARSYAGHVEDQLRRLEARAPALLDHWTGTLADAPQALDLPADKARPPRQTFVGATHGFSLDDALLAGLRAVARRAGATLYATLLAAVQVLLHRLSGQEELCLGSPTSGRDDPECAAVFGYMVNPIVLRSRLSPADPPDFLGFLADTRKRLLAGLRHGDCPFPWLARALVRERDPGRSPIFQVMLAHQRVQELGGAANDLLEGRTVAAGPLRLTRHDLPHRTAELDLVLEIDERSNGADVAIRYNTDLFAAPTIARWAGHLRVLLAGIVADPTQPVTRLPLLAADERAQLVDVWSGERGQPSSQPHVAALLARQVAATPDATALVCLEEQLTYAELDRRANRLAHHLQRRGAGPGSHVAILLDRGAPLIVAILAVLKAGAAYVPIDPRYPQERQQLLLADAGASLIVTHRPDVDGLRLASAAHVVALERDAAAIADESSDTPHTTATRDDAAYLLYTSGSTGRPKAVVVEHHNLLAFLTWARSVFSPDDVRGTLASTSVCFDISVFELLFPLTVGGAVLLAADALALPTLPFRDRVTLINTVPSAMAELVRSAELPASVRVVNLAGEKLSGELTRRVYRQSRIDRLYNLYGPTETTIYSTVALVPRDLVGEPTIGRAILGTVVYVLDGERQPTPQGVAGELYIGGEGVSRGYLGRHALTADRFLANPFAPGRMYRTGDLVRHRGGGELEYLGRIDQQIKLRGFRIELGEIEAALERLPAVERAVVVVRGSDGDARLVAYWSPAADTQSDPDQLRAAMITSLPRFMVPDLYVELAALPLTANGKIDRKQLPAPADTDVRRGPARPPATATEVRLAALWSELLGRADVGADDDFFALGGHSLIAAQLIARLPALFAAELPLRAVFDHSRLAELAVRIDELAASPTTAAGPAPTHRPHTGELPLSLSQRRLWFMSQLPGADVAYNMPVVVELRGPLSVDAFAAALTGLVARHDSLRTSFRLGEHGPLQVIHPPAPALLVRTDMRGVAEAALTREVERLLHRPFDLTRGPLLRADMLAAGPDRHLLVLVIHHIVADGWSLGILERELSALYAAALRGEPDPLPALPIQYADFSRWQAERALAAKAGDDLAFWRRTLADLAPLELPTDRPRPPVESFRGNHHIFTIDAALTDALRSLAHAEGATLYVALLAGLDVVLGRYADETDIAVASGNANRRHPSLEGLIGFFVDTLILRVNLGGAPTVRALLRRIQGAYLSATEHQDLPFERIVEELRPERSLSRNPLAQVGLTLQSYHSDGLTLAGVEVRHQHFRFESAKLDLLLMIREHAAGLEVVLEYNTDLYDAPTIARFAGHFTRTLHALVRGPDRSIDEIDLVDDHERALLLGDVAGITAPFSADRCIHELFEAWADRTPDAVALVDHCDPAGRVELTYDELERRANRLAHRLRRLRVGPGRLVGVDPGRLVGVDPGRLVGIYLDRGAAQVIAMLAVLKAGGAFVTLDPDHPDARLHMMLTDTGVALVITRPAVRPLPDGATAVRVEFDDTLADEPAMRPVTAVSPTDLAYLIYTSGSTGEPNGVLVEHRSLVNSIESDIHVFETGPGTRSPHLTSFNFDAALSHLLVMLCAGGTAHLLGRGPDALGPALVARMAAEKFTHAILPVAMLAALPAAELPALRAVGAGADVVSPELVARWGARRRFYNVYGPTEVTITATIARCVADGRPPAIGRPIANLRAYVLDRRGRLAPTGVPGELHLGGVGVARGYLRRPALTARLFVADPFTVGGRLYRTGDRVRWQVRGDGLPELEFLGRVDHQVKIRGHRVELAEVEHALRALPRVRDAVVTTHDGASGKRLVAYVVQQQASRDERREAERVAHWQTMHAASQSHAASDDPALDLRGWTSSFTGEPIPVDEMRVWADSTVRRISALHPRDVLEIGCGTGMLLSRIAPTVAHYHGCDLSRDAVDHVERLKTRLPGLSGVTTSHAPAHQAFAAGGRHDTIILNSVVQYFPSEAYLQGVLERAVAHLGAAGSLFVGDVRNLALARAYHCAVEAARAGAPPTQSELRRLATRALANDNELLVHPAFFLELGARCPQVTTVEIHLKRGDHHNELSLFRYDVVVRVGGPPATPPAIAWTDWRAAAIDLDRVRATIVAARHRGDAVELGFRDVPNARLTREHALATWAFDGGEREPHHPAAVDPEAVYRLAEQLGLEARLSWARGADDGAFDVWIGEPRTTPVRMPEPTTAPSSYANDPLHGASEKQLVSDLRELLGQRLPAHLVPAMITVLPAIPLTINGKVDLAALPLPVFHAGDGERDERAPESPTERALAAIWCELLGLERVGLGDNFFELGGDSIIGIQVVSRARARGISLRASQIFEQQTIAGLVAVAEVGKAPADDTAEVAGPVPLGPIQQWFFATDRPRPDHFNQAVLLVVPADVDEPALRRALRAVVRHHDALRHRFRRERGVWTQRCLADAGLGEHAIPLTTIDLSTLPHADRLAAIQASTARLQADLDLAAGPVTRAALLHLGDDQPARLFWAVHHLVVDAVSWRILLADLEAAYVQTLAGAEPVLEARSTSFRRWSQRLADQATTLDLAPERALVRQPPTPPLPVDFHAARNDRADAAVHIIHLDADQTAALFADGLRAYRLRPQELLLTALATAMRRWTGEPALWLDLEGHGREELFADLDLSRTVGWFTAMFPVRLELPPGDEPGARLLAVKEQLRAIPRRGVGFGVLRHLHPDGESLAWPAPQLSFNFLGKAPGGRAGQLVRGLADEPIGPAEPAVGPRSHLLNFNVGEYAGRLELSIEYSAASHRPATIAALADGLRTALTDLLAHTAEPTAGALSPADFPLAPLDSHTLAALAARHGGPAEISAIYPLTGLQRGLLARVLHDDTTDAYTTHIALTLHGKLDSGLLRDVWRELTARHELLRSCFHWDGLHQPLQIVRRHATMPWHASDLRGQPVAATDTASPPIALDVAPVGSIRLRRLEDLRHELVFQSHHVLLDGWSMFVLVRDMLELYRARAAGRAPKLPLPGSYETYARRLAAVDRERARRFWRADLAGFDEPTPLPGERDAPSGERRFRRDSLHLDAALTASLVAAAERERITLASVLEGAWAVVAGRHADRDDVVFGVVVSGRDADIPGIEHMAGLFIHTLPTRVRIDEAQDVWTWLRAHQVRQAERREHQHLPLADIQRCADVAPGVELLRCIFAFENYPVDQAIFADTDLRVEFAGAASPTHYPLVISALPGTRLAVHLDFDVASFDPPAISRVCAQLEHVIRGLVASPAPKLADLSLLGADDRATLLRWADGGAAPRPDPCIHTMFEAHVDRDPAALAVVVPERPGRPRETIDFGALEARANRLANLLLTRGARPGDIVALLLPRDIDVIVGVLATLKAGAAFVVLDAELPPARLAAMIADTRPCLVVGAPRLADGEFITLADAEHQSTHRPALHSAADSLAYLQFTSGTTGQPNGVLVEHRGLVNVVTAAAQHLAIGPGTRFANPLSLNFDGGLFNTFCSLCAGATMVLVPREGDHLGAGLVALMEREAVSHTLMVPAMLAAMPDAALPALAVLVVAGEACPAELVARWALGRQFLNLYGPSEASIWTTFARCEPDPAPPPIGRPIANVRVHVVDRRGRLAPPGAAGELWIGGLGVARGYHARPTLDAAKFTADPFAPGRVYRSGDRVRWRLDAHRTDGDLPALEFLGRTDDQVKIGGHRIELGEVEHHLHASPRVREAAVVVHGVGRSRRLIAYVVPADSIAFDEHALRGELRRSLADPMIPTTIVAIAALPLTVNGKLDRRALPAPDGGRAPTTRPRTEVERLLADVWRRTLRLDHVGIHDNYFELGGDSITSIQIVSQVQALGLSLRASQLFDHQTIASLAEVVGTAATTTAEQGPVSGPVPLTPIQRWFFALDLPARSHFNQAVLLTAPPGLASHHLARALHHVVDHHDILRVRYTHLGSTWQQDIAASIDEPTVETYDLSALAPADQTAALTREATRLQASLDITAGPLMRVALFDLGAHQPARLLWICHHLAVDGVSWRILIADLAAALAASSAGHAPTLPPKTTSFKQWSEQLAAHAARQPFTAERAAIAGPGTPPLPRDHHAAADRREHAVEHRVRLATAATARLLGHALRPYNVGVHELLLTALAAALARWSGHRALWIDIEGHGRERLDASLDLSRTVGWFTSLHPLRLPLAAEDPLERLVAVKEAVRGVPHHGLGYGLLRQLHPDGPALAWPRPELSFNYLGTIHREFDAGLGLRLAPEPTGPAWPDHGERPHLLAVNALIVDDGLELAIEYSRAHHNAATIAALADDVLRALAELIDRCSAPGAGAPTPSDFPHVRLDRGQLAALRAPLAGAAIESIYPLVSIQPELLAESVGSPDPAMWRTQVVLDLRGPLDPAALESAWRHVLRVHPLLRSCFAWHGLAEPVQIVLADVPLPLTRLDWSDQPDSQPALDRLCQRLVATPRPLDAPLLRLVLIHRGEHHHTLVFDSHHLQADGWSLGLILRDLAAAYADPPGPGPAATTRNAYERYLRWRAALDLSAAHAHWHTTLRGFAAATPLPGEHPHHLTPTHASHARHTLDLEPARVAAMHATAEAARVTPATVLDAAWATLLQRHAGTDDVVFGMTVSGRDVDVPGIDGLVGHFIHMLPLRPPPRAGRDAPTWLRAVQTTRAHALDHQHLSLRDIHGHSDVPAAAPLFRSFVVFENYPLDLDLFSRTGLGVTMHPGAGNTAHLPLALGAMPRGDTLELFFNYDAQIFDAHTIAAVAAQLRDILGELCTPTTEPSQPEETRQ